MQVHQTHNIGAPHRGLSQVWWWLTLTYFPRSQNPKTAKRYTHNYLPQLWCRLTKFTPKVHHIEASFTFDDDWPWPTFQGHRPKRLQNDVITITRHNFNAGSPNSSLMMSDLDHVDLLSKITDQKACQCHRTHNMFPVKVMWSTTFQQSLSFCISLPHSLFDRGL